MITYGFEKKDSSYIFKKDLSDENFYLQIEIDKENIIAKVYDKSFNEEYIPFRLKEARGSFNISIKEEAEKIVLDVVHKCFSFNNIKDRLLSYARGKYQTIAQYPWEDSPSFCTLKTTNSQKWYAIIMTIDYKLLNKDKSEEVDVVNIKLDPDKITKLIDNVNFYKAYHMNKKYWLTIVLDNNLNEDLLYSLVDESYKLVERKSVNQNNSWIIPANINFFDINKAFSENDTIVWKQSSNINAGDILYMYVTSPYSKIMYKCTATKVNIDYSYQDNNLKINRLMEIKLIKRYNLKDINLEMLRKNGVYSVRGPRKIPESLVKEIEEIYGK